MDFIVLFYSKYLYLSILGYKFIMKLEKNALIIKNSKKNSSTYCKVKIYMLQWLCKNGSVKMVTVSWVV